MPYNMFPYTDSDRLNIDWLLRKYKELTDLTSSEGYITVLIDQVHKAIVNGTLPKAAAEEIAQAAAGWLDEHVTNPDSPPLDTSLSIAGMAADAGAVGRRAFLYRGVIPAGADLNTYKDNGVWTIGASSVADIDNVPADAGSHPVMLEIVFTGTVGLQTYRELGNTGRSWQRGIVGGGSAFSNWRDMSELARSFSYHGDIEENANIAGLAERGYYTIPAGIAATLQDAPPDTTDRGYVLNYTNASGYRHQVYTTIWGKTWFRYLSPSATAGEWHEPMRTEGMADGLNAFIDRMNEKAVQYGMQMTFVNVANPSMPANYGTAQDLFKMIVHAWYDYAELHKFYAVPSSVIYAYNRANPAIPMSNARLTSAADVIGDSVQTWDDGITLGDFTALLSKSGSRDGHVSYVLIGKATTAPGKLFVGTVTGAALFENCCKHMRKMLAGLRDGTEIELPEDFEGTACAALLDEDATYNPYTVEPEYSKTGNPTRIGSTTKIMVLMTAEDTIPSWGDRVQVRSTVGGSGTETINSDDVLTLHDFALCMMLQSVNRCASGMAVYAGNLMRYQPFGGR